MIGLAHDKQPLSKHFTLPLTVFKPDEFCHCQTTRKAVFNIINLSYLAPQDDQTNTPETPGILIPVNKKIAHGFPPPPQ